MTRDDLLERVAFWQVGLMDIDHLRDVAYEALETPFDCTEFRVIAGDARLDHDDARALLEKALRAAGLSVPTVEQSERVVAASIARSVLAGSIDPLWAGDYISHLDAVQGLPDAVWAPLLGLACECCNGVEEMVDPEERARRWAECRTESRDHLRTALPELEAAAGLRGTPTTAEGGGFLGWRRPEDSERVERKNLDRRIRWVLIRIWDPIGVSHEELAQDEYDSYLPTVRRILLTEAPEETLARRLREYLRDVELERMGLDDSEVAVRQREVAIQELLSLLS